MLYVLTLEELLGKRKLRGIKAKHTPYELTDGPGWEMNPEHEEEVTLLEYEYNLNRGIPMECIVFMRSDSTLGRDRLDSFTIIPE